MKGGKSLIHCHCRKEQCFECVHNITVAVLKVTNDFEVSFLEAVLWKFCSDKESINGDKTKARIL